VIKTTPLAEDASEDGAVIAARQSVGLAGSVQAAEFEHVQGADDDDEHEDGDDRFHDNLPTLTCAL
jgi:hypothetical protein